MEFLFNLISGISLGSIYAIIALGYTMVYGIAKMLNFAHGDVIMVGAYICFFATARYGMNPLMGVLLSMVVCTVLGIVIERLAYKPLRQAPALAVLITAIGMSYFLQNAAQLLWTSSPKVFPSVVKGSVKLFDGAFGCGYPPEEAERKRHDTDALKRINGITKRTLTETWNRIDPVLVRKALCWEKVRDYALQFGTRKDVLAMIGNHENKPDGIL